jgi:K+-transporting ATPase ATPase C chain
MLSEFRPAFVMILLMSLITGLAYPLVVTGIAKVAFPRQASGSLIERDGKAVGSELIGQPFSDPKYFWSRASATAPFPYNAGASGGSNQGPLNPALSDAVAGRIKALRDADPDNRTPVPVDLVTASGSGLDPHISVKNALLQAPRVAKERSISVDVVKAEITKVTAGAQFGILGDPGVNVLKLNLALDAAFPKK